MLTCSTGEIVGESLCSSRSRAAVVSKVTKVASTMEVDINVQAGILQFALEAIFKRGIADTLDIPIENVAKLTVDELVSGSGPRRLQEIATNQYEVSYEVIATGSMDPDDLVSKANRITTPGTAESRMFQQLLTTQDGVAQVRQVVAKILARKFQDEIAIIAPPTSGQQDQDEASWDPKIVLAVTFSSLLVCLVLILGSAFLLKRKLARVELKASPTAGPMEDDLPAGSNPVVTRVPSRTLLNVSETQQKPEAFGIDHAGERISECTV